LGKVMKKASIISIGNELLSGQIVDTNAAYLSGRLLSIGIPVVSTYTIGDDVDSIVRTLKLASEDVDVVLATGGLGATDDDVTRQALAKFLGSKLQLQNEFLEKMQNEFDRRGRSMCERDKIQAYMPEGAKALENKLGIAPGIVAEYKGKLFFVLPGVPAEMKEMFESNFEFLIKNFELKIKNSSRQAIAVRKLKCFGASESAIADLVGDVMKRGRNPLINCTAEHGIITLHIVATAKDKNTAERMAEKDKKMLRKCLGEVVYGVGEQTLAEVVGEELARRGKTLTVAESCTGGALSKLITDVAGASRYFTHGWVAYSNQAKVNELDVSKDLIEKYGAVSEQAAKAMADGARKKAKTDFAIGITGIAGPSGGSEQKPVGVVYISVSADNYNEAKRFIFSGNRQLIQLRAALTGLNMLRLRLSRIKS
jgi:nicotinamide-nucleotide amidase